MSGRAGHPSCGEVEVSEVNFPAARFPQRLGVCQTPGSLRAITGSALGTAEVPSPVVSPAVPASTSPASQPGPSPELTAAEFLRVIAMP